MIEQEQQEEIPPAAAEKTAREPKPEKPPTRLEPTRYGDWEKNGRCIDF